MPQMPMFMPSKLTLGTVQIGLPYGIANTGGQPSDDQADRILTTAFEMGMKTFDTARSYGVAEERIGQWLRKTSQSGVNVVTKIPPMPAGDGDSNREFILRSVARSRKALRLEELPLVLFHRASDLLLAGVADCLGELVAENCVCSYGISVYDIETLSRALDARKAEITAVQLPASVADQRFLNEGMLATLAAKKITVFARSAFLQGALLMPSGALPAHLSELRVRLEQFDEWSSNEGLDRIHALIRYNLQTSGITSTVLGVENEEQLGTLFKAAAAPDLPESIMGRLKDLFSDLPDSVLDPRKWPKSA